MVVQLFTERPLAPQEVQRDEHGHPEQARRGDRRPPALSVHGVQFGGQLRARRLLVAVQAVRGYNWLLRMIKPNGVTLSLNKMTTIASAAARGVAAPWWRLGIAFFAYTAGVALLVQLVVLPH